MSDSDQLVALTAAGGPVQIGGKMLTLRQLHFEDIGQLRAWVKDKLPRPMDFFIKEMQALLPMKEFDPEGYAEARKTLLLEAHKAEQQNAAGGSPENAMSVTNSDDTLAYMLWLSVRRDHPEETFETIKEKLKGENLNEIKAKLDRINQAWMPKKPKDQQDPLAPAAPLPG